MKTKAEWPKAITEWHEGRTGYLSIPFTWLLPAARKQLRQCDFFTHRWVVGGPAVQLMPGFLAGIPGVAIGDTMPGVLQRVNPQATRTTVGCIRQCEFCGVKRIEGGFRELDEWPDLPILCDNNLLAASVGHFDRVIDRLVQHGWCDFNQGLDARLLQPHHARRIAEIKKPIVRLALDDDGDREAWATAVETLLDAGVAKSRIRSLVLVGFNDGPEEARQRCKFVETHGIKPSPMWYHRLDALEHNVVTPAQQKMGWTKRKQRELFCWYYQHRTLSVRG